MARAKEFEEDKAIDQSLEVFWSRGYEQASLALLLEATNLHKGSLYAAFKSKENLFFLCLERYIAGRAQDFVKSGEDPKAYITKFFSRKLNYTAGRRKKGCLLMNSCVEFANAKDAKGKDAKRHGAFGNLDRFLGGIESNLEMAVSKGIEEGHFAEELDANAVAQRLIALAFTIEEMGKMGKSKAFLRNVANGVLRELEIRV